MLLPLAVALQAGCDAGPVDDRLLPEHRFVVTIENVTESQPLGPGIVVTHVPEVTVFREGETASEAIRLLAEEADPSLALDEYFFTDGVATVVEMPAGIRYAGAPGRSDQTVQIESHGGAEMLSVAMMLLCTNDGFTGVDSLDVSLGRLAPGEEIVLGLGAYDAGTEVNDERFDHITDACQTMGPVQLELDGNARTPEEAVIGRHPGIQGGADLDPAVYGWRGAVAKLTVTRIE